jgi:hypothetical protein
MNSLVQSIETEPAAEGQSPESGNTVRREGINWQELLGSLSLANLLLLRVWASSPPYLSDRLVYFLPVPPPWQHFAVLLTNVALLGTAIYWLRRWLTGRKGVFWTNVSRVLFVGLLLLALNSVRAVMATGSHYFELVYWQKTLGRSGVWAMASVGLPAGLLAFRYRVVLGKVLRTSLLVLSPLLLIQAAAGLTAVMKYKRAEWAGPAPAGPLGTKREPAQRVVVLLFDELDYRLAFEERPPGIRMPHFDDLRAHGYEATNAIPPGESTLYSIPGLISGRRAAEIAVRGPSRIEVRFTGEQRWTDLSATDHLFRRVRAAGYNAAVVGWYFPYCRVFGDTLSDCAWWPADYLFAFPMHGSFLTQLPRQLRALLEPRTFSLFWKPSYFEPALQTKQMLLESAITAAVNRKNDFVFAHLATTHWPYSYERRTKAYTGSGGTYQGYEDSLELADGALGRVLEGLTRSKLLDRTTIVITADHAFRLAKLEHGKFDERVPFFVRFGASVVHQREVHQVRTRQLLSVVVKVLQGQIRDANQLAGWSRTPVR